MADSLRDLIAETLAGHDVAMTRDRFLVCFCEEWRVVTMGGPLDAEVNAHREHVADVLLAALGERPDYAAGVAAGRAQAAADIRAATEINVIAAPDPRGAIVRIGDVREWAAKIAGGEPRG